jgi:hypothetical protein
MELQIVFIDIDKDYNDTYQMLHLKPMAVAAERFSSAYHVPDGAARVAQGGLMT